MEKFSKIIIADIDWKKNKAIIDSWFNKTVLACLLFDKD